MTTTAPPTTACTLEIGGMTCASCVGRVERALTRVEGVAAAEVNLATEVATVRFDPAQVGLDELTAAVGRAGYTATPRREEQRTSTEAAPEGADEDDAQLAALRRRWQVTLAVGLGLMALMYVPLYLDAMDWLMPAILVIATVVQFWAGRDIYRAA